MILQNKEYLSWEGRARRKDFLSRYFALAIAAFFVGGFAYLTASWILEWILWSVYVFLSAKIIFLIIQRLHDMGRPGWHAFYLFVPFVNIYFIYLLFFKKSAT